MSSRRRKRLPEHTPEVCIESLTHEGKGVCHIDGKAVFVDGVLPGEQVRIRYVHTSRRYDEAVPEQVLQASSHRIEPRCQHYGVCGGCSFQHVEPREQIHLKQQVLLDNLKHIGGCRPEQVLEPVTGPIWGYRRKARLGVRHVRKKGRVLVGFRERRSRYLAELSSCPVLVPALGERLVELGELVAALSIREQIPQIEAGFGDDTGALIFRVLAPPDDEDRRRLAQFARDSGLHLYLQPAGPDSIVPLWPVEEQPLHYSLPDQDIRFEFSPVLFTQVNGVINQAMINQALALLQPRPDDRILELFCGLGNFTLPLARQVAHVSAVEGEAGLAQLARDNAQSNGIDNVDYYVANLFEDFRGSHWARQDYDQLLIDPPRSGAREVCEQLPWTPRRIVYVSCNPATLARDAGILRNKGYRLTRAGVMDMFPHTAHVESIAEFEK